MILNYNRGSLQKHWTLLRFKSRNGTFLKSCNTVKLPLFPLCQSVLIGEPGFKVMVFVWTGKMPPSSRPMSFCMHLSFFFFLNVIFILPATFCLFVYSTSSSGAPAPTFSPFFCPTLANFARLQINDRLS